MICLWIVAWMAQGAHPCAPCHARIVADYGRTAMARTSARAGAGKPGEFQDAATGVKYRVDAGLRMHFEKGGDLRGVRQLEWVVGSGRVGHSYLFREGARLYQAPVSWYGETGKWGLSPGFQRAGRLDLTRVIEPGCLNCHVSGEREGITCERCHGEAEAHRRSGGKLPVVNPAKLGPAERDSVCAQCHLTGAARVAKYRADAKTWKPGEKLADYSAVYLAAGQQGDGLVGVTSHFEKLALSECQKKSGERMSCTSCHDPHREPAEAAAYFNAKCLGCHEQKPCRQAPRGNCVGCHMPKAAGRGVDHSSYTDHSIARQPGTTRERRGEEWEAFWPGQDSARDRGVALAVLKRFEQARDLLAEAVAKASGDVTAMSQLAQIEERSGREAEAVILYERILAREPGHLAALVNLGVERVKRGRVEEAIGMWRKALAANPVQTGVRMNLAQALMRLGRRTEAVAEVEEALRLDPDQPRARALHRKLKPN
ncbi:MAG: tetratricopeptide repeat protein [Acidobacteriota bacterium]